MPNGAPVAVMVSAIPTIIRPIANTIHKTLPVIISTSASRFHNAAKGHKNHGVVFLADIYFPQQYVQANLVTYYHTSRAVTRQAITYRAAGAMHAELGPWLK